MNTETARDPMKHQEETAVFVSQNPAFVLNTQRTGKQLIVYGQQTQPTQRRN